MGFLQRSLAATGAIARTGILIGSTLLTVQTFVWPNTVHAAETPYLAETPRWRVRWHDFLQGVRSGRDAFLTEVEKGGFTALTGVEPRQPIRLLEGATYQVASDNSITFVLSDGTVVPPLSKAGYERLKRTLPTHQQYVLDEKFFWHLQRNPAIPLIAAGLEAGNYQDLLGNQVFDTDAYYLGPLMGHLFWAAQTADVSLEELLPLVEVHLLTLEFPYLREADLAAESGAVRSFYKYELELTNKQYLMRSLLTTPLEPWARLESIRQVEAVTTKQEYTDAETTSTTIALGRLPLPTPTAAEDTPGVHALNIAHLAKQGIDLFPADLEQVALEFESAYKRRLDQETFLRNALREFADTHHERVLGKLDDYRRQTFWRQIGLTKTLTRQSVNQMDTSRLLGIFATRMEFLKRSSAAESYQDARVHFIKFFQDNSPGLDASELLTVLLCDQAFNPRLWRTLKRQHPELSDDIRDIQQQIADLEAAYVLTANQEAAMFRRLQAHDLDITTEAFSLLSVAMAKRLSDLVYVEFKPGDRKHPDYLAFTRALYPFLRDMPGLNSQWGDGYQIKRYGLDNYVVPNLMALHPDDAPTLSAIGSLWHRMVSNGDLNRWDINTFVKLLNTGYNLSSNHPPASLPPEQVALLPLVDKYRPELKRVAGVDGQGAPTVLHGLARLDFRIDPWPTGRYPESLRVNRLPPTLLQRLFPFVPADDIHHIAWSLSNRSGEPALALPLVLLHNPFFVLKPNGAVDMQFELDGYQRILPDVNRYFEAIYSPAYLARIALPYEADRAYVDALNQVVRTTHALYGGYTPEDMSLPEPLRSRPGE